MERRGCQKTMELFSRKQTFRTPKEYWILWNKKRKGLNCGAQGACRRFRESFPENTVK